MIALLPQFAESRLAAWKSAKQTRKRLAQTRSGKAIEDWCEIDGPAEAEYCVVGTHKQAFRKPKPATDLVNLWLLCFFAPAKAERAIQLHRGVFRRIFQSVRKESIRKETDREKRHALEAERGIRHTIITDTESNVVACPHGHLTHVGQLRRMGNLSRIRGGGDIVVGHCTQCGKLPGGEWRRVFLFQPQPEMEIFCPVYPDVEWNAYETTNDADGQLHVDDPLGSLRQGEENARLFTKDQASIGDSNGGSRSNGYPTEVDCPYFYAAPPVCVDEFPPTPSPLPPIEDPGIDLWTWVDIDGQRVKMPWSLVRTGDRLWNKDFTASNLVVEIEDLHESFDRPNEPCEWYVVNQSVIFFRNQSVVLSEGLRHATHLEIGSTFDNGLIAETVDVYRGAHQWRRVTLNDGGDRTYWLNDFPVHNANRFYVGGTGNWDSTDTTNISATSGGVGGASCPTSADDFTMNSASSATSYTFTTRSDSAPTCRNWTVSNPASGTVSYGGNGQLVCFGSLDWTGATFTWGGRAMNFKATTTGNTINFGSNNLFSGGGAGPTFDGVGGGWTLQSALYMANVTDGVYLRNGTLDLNGQTITLNSGRTFFLSNTTSTRVLTMGAATVICGAWDASVTTGLTVNCGTSTITVSGGGFAGGGLIYASVVLDGTSAQTLSGTNTFTNLSRTNASGYASLALSANQTVTGTFTVTGADNSANRLYVASDTIGTTRTITAAVCSLTNVDFEDITGAGAGTWSGTSVGNCGGLSGITATTPTTVYWTHGASASYNFSDASRWFAADHTTPAQFPLPQDTAIADAGSFSAGGKTIAISISGLRLPSINWTGATNTPTFSFHVQQYFYGSWTGISGMTLSASQNFPVYTFRGRSSYTLKSAGKTWPGHSSCTLEMRAPNGTLTLQDAWASSEGSQFALYNGTFNDGGFNLTLTDKLNLSGSSSTRAFISSGTVTAVGGSFANGALLANTTTGLSVTHTGTLQLSGSAANNSAQLGNYAWNTITVTQTSGNVGFSSSGGTPTVSSLTLSIGASATMYISTGAVVSAGDITFGSSTGLWQSTGGTGTITITGSTTLAAGMTMSYTQGIAFTATASKTITSNGKSFGACALTFNGAGGTWTLQDNLTSASTILVSQGTLALNGKTATASTVTINGSSASISQAADSVISAPLTLTQGTLALSSFILSVASVSTSNSNTRSITGTGTLLLTGTGTVFDASTGTGLTVAPAILINDASGTTKTFNGGGRNFPSVTLSGGGSGQFNFTGDGTTITVLDIGAQKFRRTAGTTLHVGSILSQAGSSIDSITGAQHTLAKSGSGVITVKGTVAHSIASPAATFFADSAAFDLGNNTGWTFLDSVTVTPDTAELAATAIQPSIGLGAVTINAEAAELVTEVRQNGAYISPRPNARTITSIESVTTTASFN